LDDKEAAENIMLMDKIAFNWLAGRFILATLLKISAKSEGTSGERGESEKLT
jgi:hypothetical protein